MGEWLQGQHERLTTSAHQQKKTFLGCSMAAEQREMPAGVEQAVEVGATG